MEIIAGPRSWEVKKREYRPKLIIFLLAIILLIFFIFRAKQPSNFQKPNLKDIVATALAGSTGTYGVVVENLKTGEGYNLNEHQVFEAGSLYKIWLMAEVFQQIEDGKLTEDQVLSEDVATLHQKFNISSDSAELKEGTVTLTVKDALNQMITISHNYAALLLAEKVKLSLAQPATTTPSDIALFFEKLYKGELVSQDSSQKMIDLLKRQTLNDKLPKNLPKDVPIAHKTAEIGYFSHDGGIVFTPKGDYIIVILSESDYPPGAEERIAQISKGVYDYFEGKL